MITDNLSTMTDTRTITCTYEDWWVCECGNTPNSDGFYSCKIDGEIVSPDIDGDWDGIHYYCLRCGVIINQYNFCVVADASEEMKTKNDNYDWSNY